MEKLPFPNSSHVPAVLRESPQTGKVVVVTRFGEPVAEVVPPHAPGAEALGGSLAEPAGYGDIFLLPAKKTIGKPSADETAAHTHIWCGSALDRARLSARLTATLRSA